MSGGSESGGSTEAISTGASKEEPQPMGVEDLLDVLRAAVTRLPRDSSPVIGEEAS